VRLAPVLVILSLIGCGGSAVNSLNKGSSSPLTVTSPDLPGGTFPREFTCDGANRRPHLQWSTPPSGTRELVIEMLDPDAPGGTFTHWLVYGIPPGTSSLAAVRSARQKASMTSADAATAARARRAAPRTITTSWFLRWTPGWTWPPERHDPIWNHASAVTCSPGANWSPPTIAPEHVRPAPAPSPAGTTMPVDAMRTAVGHSRSR
jgi:hypothetical protein